MKKIQDQIEFYTFFHRLYLMLSFVILSVFAFLAGRSYFTKIRESVTMIDLSLVLILFLLAAYLRINALHYHSIAIQLRMRQEEQLRTMQKKQPQKPRSHIMNPQPRHPEKRMPR
ncbi:hypothetical protein NRIC_35700 [Enterococcus florum]|uniref:Uncharacterized protein n=1 Tax=Enterococcus florum TaxID=2480627 RepID=A0A4V0WQ05_9ENTE|nr:hypothetical protein [Enterococcus florum]GCF95679.1 hypothetical protein NRIC_35700 [Enterococcus florum]